MENLSPRTCRQDFSLPRAQTFSLKGGDHGLLLLHGFTACPSQLFPLAQLLNQQGFSVHCVRLPGHGTTPEAMGRTNWHTWLEAARLSASELSLKYKYFSVGGLSMGGVLSLLLAEEKNYTACVTLSAPMKAANKLAPLTGFLYPLCPTVHCLPNIQRTLLDEKYDLGYTSYPTKKVADLNKLIKMSRQNLEKVTCPLLSVQSEKDTTIIQKSMDIIQNSIKSKVKKAVWLKEAPHVITLSKELPLIADAMTDFLKKAENL